MNPEQEKMVTPRWRRVAVYGNIALGIAEAATGRLDNLAVLADAVHNVGDGVTYSIQAADALDCSERTPENIRTRRKGVYAVLAAGSLAVGSFAAKDLIIGGEQYFSDGALAVSAASVAFNSLLAMRPLRALFRRHQRNTHEHDILKHVGLIDLPSSYLALAGTIMQKYGVAGIKAEELAAVASSALAAYAFWPSKDNLEHHHHS